MATLPSHLQSLPVGRDPLSREVMEAHQRERVLDAATEVFAKRGYQGTTVDHIVSAAQVGVGSFYNLFDGKEDCFIQVYDRVVADARERIAAAIPAEAAWVEQVLAALQALLELTAEQPFQARIALAEVQTAGPTALARYEETLDSVIPLLRRGRAFSPLAAELPPTLEEATVGGIAWLLHQRLVMGEVKGIEALLPELVEIAVEPYVGEDEVTGLLAGMGAPNASG